jgi:hypothetical protein
LHNSFIDIPRCVLYNHLDLVSLPPLPEGVEVEERAIVTDDNQGAPCPEREPAGSQKSAASSEKEVDSEATTSAHSPPPAVSPRNKRKRDEVVDSGPSKTNTPAVEEVAPTEKRTTFDPYADALISS